MRTLIVLITGFLVSVNYKANSQSIKQWNNKKCAVVLTYDDALNVHLDNAIPLLDSLKLKATFYLSGFSNVLRDRMNEWRTIAKNGHELGNHTYFHPCTGNRPGREFVTPDYDLGTYSIRRITDEILMTNTVLTAIDGKKNRTFAYPCGDTKIKDSFYLDPVKNEFAGARGVQSEMHSPDKINLYVIGSYMVNNHTGQQLIELAKKAMESNALIVFLFHGVGGEHSLNVSLPTHKELLLFLKKNEKDIWIAPMVEVATFIAKNKVNSKG